MSDWFSKPKTLKKAKKRISSKTSDEDESFFRRGMSELEEPRTSLMELAPKQLFEKPLSFETEFTSKQVFAHSIGRTASFVEEEIITHLNITKKPRIEFDEPQQNPWRTTGDSVEKLVEFDHENFAIPKVVFIEEPHGYVLQDEYGSYPELIISATSVQKYWSFAASVIEKDSVSISEYRDMVLKYIVNYYPQHDKRTFMKRNKALDKLVALKLAHRPENIGAATVQAATLVANELLCDTEIKDDLVRLLRVFFNWENKWTDESMGNLLFLKYAMEICNRKLRKTEAPGSFIFTHLNARELVVALHVQKTNKALSDDKEKSSSKAYFKSDAYRKSDKFKPLVSCKEAVRKGKRLIAFLDDFKEYAGTYPLDYAEHEQELEMAYNISYRVLSVIEEWIYIRPSREIEMKQADYEETIQIMRFIRDDQGGFSGFKTKGLANELHVLYLRIAAIIPDAHEKLMREITENELKYSYNNMMRAGTKLHKYIENKIKNEDDETMMRENEDYIQVESFLDDCKKEHRVFLPENSEKRLGSFRYKICGSFDAALRIKNEKTGIYTFQIWDWKRMGNFENWGVKGAKHSYSSDYTKYCLQAAVYCKLHKLDFPDDEISSEAMIVMFHPTFNKYKKFVLYLEEPMGRDTLSMMKGITRDKRQLSPKEWVDALFENRLQHLHDHFKGGF